ncbi:hypothetical protein EX30DRAFT_337936 [Ascodesmis nigricans]|uniref:RRM domain-containing protein n=1 Tax=Ascodesmis nigricans TaxID=341454 RepID=A0A4V3SJW4_9PEZI|nr:hypothetical protein EX30DRAFT_337936 [Ascodesmis nigricans]
MSGGSIFASSSFTPNNGAVAGTPEQKKQKLFQNWHEKQGINAPQDYSTFAGQPSPFASKTSIQSSATSQYLQKIAHQATPLNNDAPTSEGADFPEASRRKPPLKRSTSQNSPPLSNGAWPKSMFGSRPAARTRARHSATPDFNIDQTTSEGNLPPLTSMYDDLPFDAATTINSGNVDSMTPTQVRVSGFSNNRFNDVVRGLRRYYGPILEAYSGLPESECKFPDPEIYPRESLSEKVRNMTQPCTGTDEVLGNWVRITFKDREAAEQAVAGSASGQFMIGGRRLTIAMWDTNSSGQAVYDDSMELDAPPTDALIDRRNSAGRRNSTGRRNSLGAVGARSFTPGTPGRQPQLGNNGEYSQHVPGAKVLAPKQVAFQKKDGWLSGWIGGAPAAKPAQQAQQQGGGGWGSSIAGGYRYLMDEVVGFKYL